MALTREEAAQRARDILTEESEAARGLSLAKLMGLVPTALEVFSKRVATADDYEGLQKTYTAVVITAGVLDLTVLAAALFNPLRAIVYPTPAANPAVFFGTIEALVFGDLPTGAAEAVYFAQKGTALQFRNNTDGSLTTLASTTAVVVCNHIPTIGDVPDSFTGAFLLELAQLAAIELMPQGIGQKVAEALAAGRA